MTVYSELTPATAEKILHLYGLKAIGELHPLSRGISNSNYRVETAEGDYILKISNDKGMKELDEEQRILLFLKSAHFPYSLTPVLTQKGQWIYEVPPYFGVVYPFVKGETPPLNAQSCSDIGRAMGQLHRCSLDSLVPAHLRSYAQIGDDAQKIIDYVHSKQALGSYREAFARVFPDGLAEWNEASLPQGIIHGDLYYDNTLFNQHKLAAILDFEQAGVGPLLLDIGISISGTCLNNQAIDRELMKAFMAGYEEQRVLTSIERKLLDTSLHVGLFSIALWRIKRFTVGKLDPQKKNSFQELLNRSEQFLASSR